MVPVVEPAAPAPVLFPVVDPVGVLPVPPLFKLPVVEGWSFCLEWEGGAEIFEPPEVFPAEDEPVVAGAVVPPEVVPLEESPSRGAPVVEPRPVLPPEPVPPEILPPEILPPEVFPAEVEPAVAEEGLCFE